MRGLARILSLVVAAVAILSASGWSSGAVACQIPPGMEMVTGGASPPSPIAHKAMHHRQPASRPAKGDPPQGPADPRLDCAACVGVLPNFPSVGQRMLMPFMPEADLVDPLPGIQPTLEPPPPRG